VTGDPAVRQRAIVLVAVLTVVWGTNWPVFPFALRELSIWTFRLATVLLAGTALMLAARIRGESLSVPRRLWGPLAFAGIFNLGYWNIATAGAALYLPSGQVSVLGFTMPLWSALIGAVVFRERMSRRSLVAVLLGGVAVALLMAPNFSAYANAPLGLALGLSAGLAWAIGTFVIKRTDWGGMGLSLTGWQMVVSILPLAAGTALFADFQWFVPQTSTIVAVVYIGLIPMAIGTATWFAIVGLLPANIAGLSSVCVPIVAMVSGALIHDEPLGPIQLAAMACTAASLWLALVPASKKPAP
jgi:drug/metabolite transporter (DMT)-like permease